MGLFKPLWQRMSSIKITRRLFKFSLLSEFNKALEIAYLLFIAILVGGVMNAILEGSRLPAGYIIAPVPSLQTLSETVINVFAIIFGTSGIYLLYKSGKQVVRQRISNLYLITGFFMIFLAIIIGLFIYGIKRF